MGTGLGKHVSTHGYKGGACILLYTKVQYWKLLDDTHVKNAFEIDLHFIKRRFTFI